MSIDIVFPVSPFFKYKLIKINVKMKRGKNLIKVVGIAIYKWTTETFAHL